MARLLCLLICAAFGPLVHAGTVTLFTDEAGVRGVTYECMNGDWNSGFGAGIVFADVDNDGDPDLIVSGAASWAFGVYENDGAGQFTNRSQASGIPPIVNTSGLVAGDYDGDGDLDLYVTVWNGPNRLFRHVDGLVFEDATTGSNLEDDGASHGAAFGDFDGDGLLDLYVANRTYPQDEPGLAPSRLYHNSGGGVFEEVGALHGVDDRGASFQPAFFDHDLDGDLDLYVANDKGLAAYPNRLWSYDQLLHTYVDVSGTSGGDVIGDFMGLAIGDFDRNGYPDVYTTNVPSGNALLLNQGGGVFIEGQATAGVEVFATGWGALFLDYDNDGDEDLYVANNLVSNVLYRYDGAFPVTDVAAAEGLDIPGNTFCIAAADLENDGDLDLVVQNLNEEIRLMVNHLEAVPDAGHYLKVRLVGRGGNVHAVGARVEVIIDGQAQTRQLLSGSGYKSTSSQVLHFGLGAAEEVDQLTVYWPDGEQASYTSISADQTVTLFADGVVPALDHVHVIALGVLLAGAAVVLIRRRAVAVGPR